MSAPWLMVIASFLFASMAVCVKLASVTYSAGEIVLYRGLTGAVLMLAMARWRGESLRTRIPMQHAWRSVSGVVALTLWFYAIGNLPLATAMTLNYMSSVWMALFMVGGAAILGTDKVDGRLIATVLLGFVGVGLILRPTIEQEQLWHGLAGLLSGVIAATAYLQVTALGRAGEPDFRIVFYFSIGSVLAGGATLLYTGAHAHTAGGLAVLLAAGVLATLAQLLMTRAYSTGRTLVNASLQYLGIAYSFADGLLLFDEHLTPTAVAGMVLVVGAGVAAAMIRSTRAPHVAATPTET